MRGRGDSGRETTVPARGGFPERTLRQDELRAERPPAADDDIFGDLYLDFEDAPTREPVERIEPAQPPAPTTFDDEYAAEAEPEPEPESAYEPEPRRAHEPDPQPERADEPAADRVHEPDPDHAAGPPPAPQAEPDPVPAPQAASASRVASGSLWDQAPRPTETFANEPEANGVPDPVPHTVTPRAVRPDARTPAPPPPVPAPPTVAGGSADTTFAAGHAVPPPPTVPPMPTSPPPVPAPQTELLPAAVPVPEPVEDADELDVPTTSRSDSLRRAEAAEEDPRAHSGPPLGVQASAWSTSSHPGRRRAARRERRGLGPELTARDNDDRYAATGEVFIVADGLGGHPAGWYAADVAVRTLVAELAAADLSAGWSDRLSAAIAVADLAVRRHGVAQYEGMRTTVVAAVLQHGRLHLAGCGDSVCWLVRGGRAFRLTEQGNAAEFGRPWLLTSTPLGGSQAPEPELQRIELHPGDRVVLATDGVGHLPDETVADLVHGDPFHAATTLTRTAVESGDDDATAVVVECDALPVPEGHRSGADPREQPEDASGAPGALRSDDGTAW
ncbi:PP2C family protein-serine/threonine phosphatase [Embleya sp. NPDC050493]|uniref:PP2C family protein-serine/threonine phosphatase n=1 Tax=Embleya sp. NPDC050493 TaxID=3363989 RepID=UPI00378DF591